MTTRTQRVAIREYLELSQQNRYPIEVVAGNSAPRIVGMGFHYRTKGGTRIWHPSAYSKHGWSNMVYVSSNVRIEVGAQWLAVHQPKERMNHATFTV